MFSGLPARWMQALEAENMDVIEQLLGEYSDAKNDMGQTALMLAARSSFTKIVTTILPRSIHLVDSDGKTALHYAAEGNSTDILELFMHKIWLQTDEKGMTPIEHAIECKNADALSFFLRHKFLQRDNLEAARILAAECGSQEIVKLLNEYEPLDSLLSSNVSILPEEVNKKAISSKVKRLIAEVRDAFTNHTEAIDGLIEALLREASVTSSLGDVLAPLYKKRIKTLKTEIEREKKTVQRLTEDVKSGIESVKILMAEVERLQREIKTPVELVEASVEALETPEMISKELQLSQIDFCKKCDEYKTELDQLKLSLNKVSQRFQDSMSAHDELIAQLQQKNNERESTISDLMKKLSTYEVVTYDKNTYADEHKDNITIDKYVTQIIEELQRTQENLNKGKEQHEQTANGVDEFIQMVQGIKRPDSDYSSHQIIESLFFSLGLALVELLKERHISRLAISDKDYLECAIRDLHITAHINENQEKHHDFTPTDVISRSNANDNAFKDIGLLDDAEALGRSVCNSTSAEKYNDEKGVDKYTVSFIHSAIREASSMSTFNSDNLAKLPQVSTIGTQRTSSRNSSATLSSISFESFDSNGSTQSAPSGTRHAIVYKDKTSNAKTIIDQMIKVTHSAVEKEHLLNRSSLPPHYNKGTILSTSATQKSIDTDVRASRPADKEMAKDSYILKAPSDPRSLFGKRSAELNKSGSAPMKKVYESPQISDGCSPIKTIVADISNSWIRSSSPLNKYNPKIMKNKSPHEYYSILLNKTRSTSTPLARSSGPDYTE